MPFDKKTIKAPQVFQTESFLLRPLRVSDAVLDYEAVMETRAFLRSWEQTGWPADDFTLKENRQHLLKHEKERATGKAYTYTMMNPTETVCLGCVYLFATDASVFARSRILPIDGGQWEDVTAAVYFWVRQSRLAEALDRTLLDTLLPWLQEDWGFAAPVIVTSVPFTQQVAMIEAAGLPLKFRIQDPKAAEEFLAYGTD